MPVPNEDVYFFTKRIDNSRVRAPGRPESPCARLEAGRRRRLCRHDLIAMLLPSAYGLMAGYQLSSLKTGTADSLCTERARLELEEARLMSAERLQELARMQEFVDPAPDSTVYLTPKNDQVARAEPPVMTEQRRSAWTRAPNALANNRLRILARICLGWGVIVLLRLVELQILHHQLQPTRLSSSRNGR